MAFTEPIRDKKQLKQLAKYFLQRGQFRNHLLLVIGAHTVLRISDILRLTWGDVYDEEQGAFYSHITVTEQKTGKVKTVVLHPVVVKALHLYFPYRRSDFIFVSNRVIPAAISRVQAWRILHAAVEAVGLIGLRIGCHSLRKTLGHWAWKEGVSPVVIMEIYGHTSYDVTRRYLGIAQEDIDRAYLAATLF